MSPSHLPAEQLLSEAQALQARVAPLAETGSETGAHALHHLACAVEALTHECAKLVIDIAENRTDTDRATGHPS